MNNEVQPRDFARTISKMTLYHWSLRCEFTFPDVIGYHVGKNLPGIKVAPRKIRAHSVTEPVHDPGFSSYMNQSVLLDSACAVWMSFCNLHSKDMTHKEPRGDLPLCFFMEAPVIYLCVQLSCLAWLYWVGRTDVIERPSWEPYKKAISLTIKTA